MTNEDSDAEMEAQALGAEALPGGFAEIRRTLGPLLVEGDEASPGERRNDSRLGYDGRRKQTPANDA